MFQFAMEKLDEKGGGCKERGGSEGGSCTLRQVGVALGFAVLLAVVVAQAVWSQHQWREMGERIEALERKGVSVCVCARRSACSWLISSVYTI